MIEKSREELQELLERHGKELVVPIVLDLLGEPRSMREQFMMEVIRALGVLP